MPNKKTKKISLKEPRCIICGEKKDGLEIYEDHVIAGIRFFNRKVLRKYRNYNLVVCKQCYLKYQKGRSSFVKKRAAYILLGGVFAAILVIVSSGSLLAFLYGAIVIVLMYMLSLISYLPDLKIKGNQRKNILSSSE